jgi:ATP-dependent Lon protease
MSSSASVLVPSIFVPVLPLRDIVVFPHMIVPLFVGREKSVFALEAVMRTDHKKIVLVTQKNPVQDTPSAEDLYTIGTIGTMLQLLRLPDGTVKVLVEGEERVRLLRISEDDVFMQAVVEPLSDVCKKLEELEALQRTVLYQFESYIKINRKIPPEVLVTINQIIDPGKLADTVSSYFNLKIHEKQEILETLDVHTRLHLILERIESEMTVLQMEKRIRNRVKKQMEKTQREYYLGEQLKAIQQELHDGEDGKDEFTLLEEKIKKTKLSKEAKEKAHSELRKLRMMSSSSAESTVIRNYLEWLIGIPWSNPTRVQKNISEAATVLNHDHYALDKVKERVLEYLAVQARVGTAKGQILCLVGPPGVGKTSLGKSIAKATGRRFTRIALGGMRDESEIRGHRRTYIGSMPGKIIQGMRKAQASNPLFLLDEVDKLGNDWRGDPTSALLEVLDPEQNQAFNDHYLEVDYDLSDVMFVTTANTLKMPRPLLDRMEIIQIPGYTEDEKLNIAKLHLVPKQQELHGLNSDEWMIPDESLLTLIQQYTREAGVRNLAREIANLARKTVKDLESKVLKAPVTITASQLAQYSGVPKYKWGVAEEEDQVGVVTGLAWTEVGGDLLSIESLVVPGSGKITYTGKLGDVMQESIQAAFSFVKSRSDELKISSEMFEKKDIHIHVPEGSVPKDGPSAGISMATAIVSVLTNTPVKRSVAMTGEITLRGNILAIGGIKEKLLAAHRARIREVLIPKDNEKDLSEIPPIIHNDLKIRSVSHMDEVLYHALVHPKLS